MTHMAGVIGMGEWLWSLNEVDDENEQNCIEAPVENVDGDVPMMVIPTNSFSINRNLVHKTIYLVFSTMPTFHLFTFVLSFLVKEHVKNKIEN